MSLRRRERESLEVVEEGGGVEKVRRDGDRNGVVGRELNRRGIVCGRCRDDMAAGLVSGLNWPGRVSS